MTEETTPVVEEAVAMAAYAVVEGKITAVEGDVYTAESEFGEEFFINKNALKLTIDNLGQAAEITAGDSVMLYLRKTTPMLLSLPAQYSPTVIVKMTEAASSVDVDVYSKSKEDEFGSYINRANKLALNLPEGFKFENPDGTAFEGEADGMDFVVVYSMSTFSIPAQTTPEKVIVIPTEEEKSEEIDFSALTKIVANGKEIDYIKADGAEAMIQLRDVAEALGFEVLWSDELKSITLNGGMYMLSIGNDSYVKGRMMPISIGQAPVCVPVDDTGITFVPATYFTDVLEAEASFDAGVLTLNLAQ
jgi:hypothetical protein